MKHEDIEQYIDKILPTGSRVICNPPPLDTDEDYVVLLKDISPESLLMLMETKDYSRDGLEAYDILTELEEPDGWASFKKGSVNYIVTFDEDFFDKWVLATDIAKLLNLTNKEDRVKLFAFIKYDAAVTYNWSLLGRSLKF